MSATPDGVARAMAAVAVIRHLRVQCAYSSPEGERDSIWFEVHQGQRRKEAVEVAALLRRLRIALLRCEVDPLAVATAQLDAADEHRAKGEHDETEAALREAVRYAETYRGDPSRRNHAAVSLARYVWQRGHSDAAMRALRKLEGEPARDLLRQIESHEDARAVLRAAQREYSLAGTVESWCEVAIASLLAGHTVQAELVAREICEHHHESGVAWYTLAIVLVKLGRYRDAVVPARRALKIADDPIPDRASLARILSRLGPEGREESSQLAIVAIEAKDARELLPSVVLAKLAEVVQYAGSEIAPARRADDLVSDMAGDDPPPARVAWLGGRQTHVIAALGLSDAPEWLARLADARARSPPRRSRASSSSGSKPSCGGGPSSSAGSTHWTLLTRRTLFRGAMKRVDFKPFVAMLTPKRSVWHSRLRISLGYLGA